jgi:hypothetical protein
MNCTGPVIVCSFDADVEDDVFTYLAEPWFYTADGYGSGHFSDLGVGGEGAVLLFADETYCGDDVNGD